MFSFFTRKKNRKSKSKTSLYDENASVKSSSLKQDYTSSKSSLKSTNSSQIDNYYLLLKASKKRPAPPPPSGHNLNSVPEGNETPRTENAKVINQVRSKSVVDGRNEMTDLDRETLEKIIALTKKKKKAAPLPPTSQEENKNSLQIFTGLSPNSHDSSRKNDDTFDKYSSSPPSYPSPSLSESSSVLSNKNENSARLDEKKQESLSVESNLSKNYETSNNSNKINGKLKFYCN